MRIILTGIAGRLGRRVAQRLSRHHEVIGIDKRPLLGLPEGVVHHRVDLRRRAAEDVFKTCGADAIIHLGVVHNFRIPSERLYSRNVVGTETMLEWASKYNIKKVVLLSSGDVYGPTPGNSHFIGEGAPLLASDRFPEIRTLVAVDRAVQQFFWRHPSIETVILRPCHIVGPNVRNAPSNYLRMRLIPTMMGFDPIVQLIHEDDVARSLVSALQPGVRGVYNIAGTHPIPLSKILKILRKPILPIPHPLFRAGLNRMWRYRLTSFPPPELDHIRFNSVLDTSRAKEELNLKSKHNLYEILEPFRSERPDEYDHDGG